MLNLFEDLKIPDEKLHTKFKIIKTHLGLTGEHLILNDWVTGFQDRDNKIVKEFQTTFHSAFWEFYLYALSKEAGFEIDFSKNRPDFIIKKPIKFYIEAVVANIKQSGKQEAERTLPDILSMIQPCWERENFYETLNESITRYSNALMLKSEKYTEYSKESYWESSAPYVIALSGYEQINYGSNFHYAMLALLYGMYVDINADYYIKKQSILKPNSGAEIPIGLFLTTEFSHISAVIFSCTMTLGKLTSLAISQNKSPIKLNAVMCIRHDSEEPHFQPHIVSPKNPEGLTDGVFIFHNPFAKNPLPKSIFKETNVIHVEFNGESDGIKFDGNNLPIVSRLNLAGGHEFILTKLPDIIQSFNPDLVICLAKVMKIENGDKVNAWDVTFQDVEDKSNQFTLTFETDYLSKYNVKKNKIFNAIFKIPEKYRITNFGESKASACQKIRKVICFQLNEGHLVCLKEQI